MAVLGGFRRQCCAVSGTKGDTRRHKGQIAIFAPRSFNKGKLLDVILLAAGCRTGGSPISILCLPICVTSPVLQHETPKRGGGRQSGRIQVRHVERAKLGVMSACGQGVIEVRHCPPRGMKPCRLGLHALCAGINFPSTPMSHSLLKPSPMGRSQPCFALRAVEMQPTWSQPTLCSIVCGQTIEGRQAEAVAATRI